VSNAGKAEREKMQAARGLLSQELSHGTRNVEDLKGEIEHLSTVHSQAENDLLDLRKANAGPRRFWSRNGSCGRRWRTLFVADTAALPQALGTLAAGGQDA